MSVLDLLTGDHVLVVGIEDDAENGTPLLRVYIGARYLNQYVLVADPEDQARVRAAWGSDAAISHLTMPKPPTDLVFQGEAS